MLEITLMSVTVISCNDEAPLQRLFNLHTHLYYMFAWILSMPRILSDFQFISSEVLIFMVEQDYFLYSFINIITNKTF